jgi:hypothetical protein
MERDRDELDSLLKAMSQNEREIGHAKQAEPALLKKVQYLSDQLGGKELERRLGGQFVGVSASNQGDQLMVVVRRTIDEELKELPADLKRQLVARHLSGNQLPAKVLKALGIEEAVQAAAKAVDDALAPKTATTPTGWDDGTGRQSEPMSETPPTGSPEPWTGGEQPVATATAAGQTGEPMEACFVANPEPAATPSAQATATASLGSPEPLTGGEQPPASAPKPVVGATDTD